MKSTDISYRFRVKTYEGHIFKVLIELLQGIINSACFTINHDGIFLRMFDSHQKILVNLELNSSNFNVFELTEEMNLGLNLGHFYKMLKSIKKKDPVLLYVDDKAPDQLQFIICPHDNTRKVHTSIQIKSMQSVTCPLPGPFNHPVKISAIDFQSALKDMININSTLRIKMHRYSVHFSCESNNICSRSVVFGELDEHDPNILYDEKFDMEIFTRILKISGIGKSLDIHNGGIHEPLCIKTNIGHLGKISLYIKSNAHIYDQN